MDSPLTSYEPRRFRATVPYYARYRLGYPDSLIARVVEVAGLKPGDKVMDLGCGPGLLAIPFARAGMDVVAVDPEPEMLGAARVAADDAGVRIEVRQGSSFELPVERGPFRLVTMGRSFHWMDGASTIAALESLVPADGTLAFFDDDHPRTKENAWRFALRDIANKFGRDRMHHVVAAHRADFRTHHALLFESSFSRLEGVSSFIRRKITADEIVGLAFSLSSASRERLGERAAAFEDELRDALRSLSPAGTFTEIAELKAMLARREK